MSYANLHIEMNNVFSSPFSSIRDLICDRPSLLFASCPNYPSTSVAVFTCIYMVVLMYVLQVARI